MSGYLQNRQEHTVARAIANLRDVPPRQIDWAFLNPSKSRNLFFPTYVGRTLLSAALGLSGTSALAFRVLCEGWGIQPSQNRRDKGRPPSR